MSNDTLFREPLEGLRSAALLMLLINPRALSDFVPGTIGDALPDIRGRRLKEAVRLIAAEIDRRVPTPTPAPDPATTQEAAKPPAPKSGAWEKLDNAGDWNAPVTRRLRVPGGWLYQVSYGNSEHGKWHQPVFVAADMEISFEARPESSGVVAAS